NRSRADQRQGLPLPRLPEGLRRPVLRAGSRASGTGADIRTGRVVCVVGAPEARLLHALRGDAVLRTREPRVDLPVDGQARRSGPVPTGRTHLGVRHAALAQARRQPAEIPRRRLTGSALGGDGLFRGLEADLRVLAITEGLRGRSAAAT